MTATAFEVTYEHAEHGWTIEKFENETAAEALFKHLINRREILYGEVTENGLVLLNFERERGGVPPRPR